MDPEAQKKLVEMAGELKVGAEWLMNTLVAESRTQSIVAASLLFGMTVIALLFCRYFLKTHWRRAAEALASKYDEDGDRIDRYDGEWLFATFLASAVALTTLGLAVSHAIDVFRPVTCVVNNLLGK